MVISFTSKYSVENISNSIKFYQNFCIKILKTCKLDDLHNFSIAQFWTF